MLVEHLSFFHQHCYLLLDSCNLPLNVHPAYYFSLYPWEVSMIHVCSSPLPCAKDQLPTVTSCSLFLDHPHSHSHVTAVYSDGFKSSDGVGYAAVFTDKIC